MENAIILGSARCLFEDYDKAKSIMPEHDLIAVNMSGICYPNIVHLVSLHSERIAGFWAVAMQDNGRHITTHGQQLMDKVENAWSFEQNSGSSALYACRIALQLGYKRILLCGVPLTPDRRFYDGWGRNSEIGDRATEIAWDMAKGEFGNARSMSGKTADILGIPTEGWANGR